MWYGRCMHDKTFARIWAEFCAHCLAPRDGEVVRPTGGNAPVVEPESCGLGTPARPAEDGDRQATPIEVAA